MEYQSLTVEAKLLASPCAAGALNETQFSGLLVTLRGRAFESTRLSLAQDLLRSQCVTSAQLRRILELFTFEQTRLELARLAYPLVSDPAHFSDIYAAFEFPTSVAELRALAGQ